MSWTDEVDRIRIVKHQNGEFPFEVILYNKYGCKVYSQPLQKTGNDAWELANNLQTQLLRTDVLDMFIIDENLEEAVHEFALAENSHCSQRL